MGWLDPFEIVYEFRDPPHILTRLSPVFLDGDIEKVVNWVHRIGVWLEGWYSHSGCINIFCSSCIHNKAVLFVHTLTPPAPCLLEIKCGCMTCFGHWNMSRHDRCHFQIKLKESALPFAMPLFPCHAVVIVETLVEMQLPVSLGTNDE